MTTSKSSKTAADNPAADNPAADNPAADNPAADNPGGAESDIVASLAITLDGYIARVDGTVDFLDKYPMGDFDFDAWADRMGALVMGRSSYEQAVDFGWVWGDRPTLVLTTATDLPVPDGADVVFKAAPTAEAIAAFSAETPKRLWVFGGGNIITEALLGGVVDILDLTMIPEAIGTGIPLFTKPYPHPMKLIESVPYSNGAIRLVYSTHA